MTTFDDMRQKWSEYYKISVPANPHLELPMFHCFIGVLLTAFQPGVGYFWGTDKYHSVRLPVFMIQNPSSGKSKIMQGVHNILKRLEIKSTILSKATDASLAGRIVEYPKKGGGIGTQLFHGALSDNYFIAFDEAEVLFNKHLSSAYADITGTLNFALEEPGRVSKRVSAGTMDYETSTTVVAGSYFTKEINEHLMQEGFIHRFFLSYKNFTDAECSDIRRKSTLMGSVLPWDAEKIIKELLSDCVALRTIIPQVHKIHANRAQIGLSLEKVTSYFNTKVLGDIDEMIAGQFSDEKQGTIQSIASRSVRIVEKVATQRAFLSGRYDFVSEEDVDYGFMIAKMHIQNAMNSLKRRGSLETDQETARERVVMNIINHFNNNGNRTTKKMLLTELKKMKRMGKWDYGFNGTAKFINDLVDRNILSVETGEHQAHYLKIVEDLGETS